MCVFFSFFNRHLLASSNVCPPCCLVQTQLRQTRASTLQMHTWRCSACASLPSTRPSPVLPLAFLHSPLRLHAARPSPALLLRGSPSWKPVSAHGTLQARSVRPVTARRQRTTACTRCGWVDPPPPRLHTQRHEHTTVAMASALHQWECGVCCCLEIRATPCCTSMTRRRWRHPPWL